jgi:hypothetical protein
MTDKKLTGVRTGAAQTDSKAKLEKMEVTDSLCRVIVLRRMGPAKRSRLMKVLGGDLTNNAGFFGNALMAASVESIDGEPEEFPLSEAAVYALLDQLDEEGLAAVSNAFNTINRVFSTEEDIAAAKN